MPFPRLHSSEPAIQLSSAVPPLPPSPQWMVILNATPDSFSDGGQHPLNDERALCHWVEAQLALGATWLDVGGESTRPGAIDVPPEEEIARIRPVIETVAKHFPTLNISSDTRKAVVANVALQAGATAVNDVSGLRYDGDALLATVLQHHAGLFLTHSLGTPQTMQQLANEALPIIPTVLEELQHVQQRCVQAGMLPQAVVLDVGIGFGKTQTQNWELLQQLPSIAEQLHSPTLVGISRKRFLDVAPCLAHPQERDAATAALSHELHQRGGVWGFRVHTLAVHQQVFHALARFNVSAESP